MCCYLAGRPLFCNNSYFIILTSGLLLCFCSMCLNGIDACFCKEVYVLHLGKYIFLEARDIKFVMLGLVITKHPKPNTLGTSQKLVSEPS